MTTPRSRLGRRLLAAVSSGALAVGVLALGASPASAAPPAAEPATTTGSGPVKYVDNATFTWGVSGYAQKGIFGPWRFLNPTGNASVLTGATQTEYQVDPVPVTSMPASGGSVPPNPNAVKLTAGTGAVDPATGAGKLSWTGSYTINAYPAMYGAPDETYTDPILTIAADGSGSLTANFGLGAGSDMEGNPVAAANFGRLAIADFAAGSLTDKTVNGYRATPKYQGVEVTIPAEQTQQNRTCAATGGATGWWGSVPQSFITTITGSPVGKSVAPHFYSTGCGGLQDNKPQLPVDVTYTADEPDPKVTISNTKVSSVGATTVTVTGTGFHPVLGIGTRPPISGRAAGTYVLFGKFAESWQPSLGSTLAPSGNRKQVNGNPALTKWAVPAADLATVGGAPAGGVLLGADGSFSTTVTIDKATLDAASANTPTFRYGIYTYGASGAVAPSYETYTPVTFFEPGSSTITLDQAAYEVAPGESGPVEVTVSGEFAPAVATGTVKLFVNDSVTEADTDTLVAGKATLQLPDDLAVGSTGTVKVTYSGDGMFAAGTSASSTYAVSKNVATVALDQAAYSATIGTAVPVGITVSGAAGIPAGQVSLTYTPTGGVASTPVAADLDAAGKATISLPSDLVAGTGAINVSYAGNATYGTASKASTYTIAKKVTAITNVAGPAKVAYRTAATYTIPVSNGATGTVKVSGAGGPFYPAIVNGTATFALPATLPAGARTLKVEYLGSATNAPAAAVNKTIAISKGAVALSAKVTKKWTSKKSGRLTVAVTSVKGGPVPTGKVSLVLKKGSVTKTVKAKVLKNGKVVLVLPKSSAGKWSVKVKYAGSSQHSAVTKTFKVKVKTK